MEATVDMNQVRVEGLREVMFLCSYILSKSIKNEVKVELLFESRHQMMVDFQSLM